MGRGQHPGTTIWIGRRYFDSRVWKRIRLKAIRDGVPIGLVAYGLLRDWVNGRKRCRTSSR